MALPLDLQTLEERYSELCRWRGILPNAAILSGFWKADVKRSCHELCSLEIRLDDLKDIDVHPLIDLGADICASEIEAVDVRNKSSRMLNGELALPLMRAFKQKLRAVDLQDPAFGKEFLRDLLQRGLPCEVLKLRSYCIRKLNMMGEFKRIHTLNLDYCISLIDFKEDCFACMPNLRHLSMRETRVTNLWTTVAALSKLPSLVDLRFQDLCCNEAGPSPTFSPRSGDEANLGQLNNDTYYDEADGVELTNYDSSMEEMLGNLFPVDDMVIDFDAQSDSEDSSQESDLDFSNFQHDSGFGQLTSNVHIEGAGVDDTQHEDSVGTISWTHDDEDSAVGTSNLGQISDGPLKYTSCHASSICYEKHYREYMIASLPQLEILDKLRISGTDRQNATDMFSQCFEYLPYKRKYKESVVSILQMREIKSSLSRSCNTPRRKSQYFYSRSLSAAKVGSSAWPYLHPLTISWGNLGEKCRSFRPRQFEYHPSDPSLMAFGTLDGEVVVINHESKKLVRYIPSRGDLNCVLGLCWLKKYPLKLVAGSDNGSLKLYDIQYMPSTVAGAYTTAGSVTFDDFDQLTSVHVNSTDELFLASGYSRDVALYDIGSGRRLQVFADMHQAHINVVKFSHHSPSIFATSSFDQNIKMWDLRQKPIRPCFTVSSSKGNVMVCFSPDDHYLLASAVDNEVKQLLAVDGRVHLDFDIESTGSSLNYTRSYYMNGRDYVISGSCDEHVVRVCCAKTGRRLRDVSLEERGPGNSMFVQSLRGDPFRDFNMSILAAYMLTPTSKSQIVKVNLLATNEYSKEHSESRIRHASNSWGG